MQRGREEIITKVSVHSFAWLLPFKTLCFEWNTKNRAVSMLLLRTQDTWTSVYNKLVTWIAWHAQKIAQLTRDKSWWENDRVVNIIGKWSSLCLREITSWLASNFTEDSSFGQVFIIRKTGRQLLLPQMRHIAHTTPRQNFANADNYFPKEKPQESCALGLGG